MVVVRNMETVVMKNKILKPFKYTKVDSYHTLAIEMVKYQAELIKQIFGVKKPKL